VLRCPLFVHSDLFKANHFIRPTLKKKELLDRHLEILSSISSNLWFPSFNYQFLDGVPFDVLHSQCEVGLLPELFRLYSAKWRSLDPVFSVTGNGELPNFQKLKKVTAFETDCIFEKLIEQKGYLLFYGVDLTPATIIHYLERRHNVSYRYAKKFNGEIHTLDETYELDYIFHVRPMGSDITYDWQRLLKDLTEHGIAKELKPYMILISSVDLFAFWYSQIEKDPFYFLDLKTQKWVKRKLEKFGRPFKLKDFETFT